MKKLILLFTVLTVWVAAAHAATTIDRSLLASGGQLATAGTVTLSADVGDVLAGYGISLPTVVEHGFWATPSGQVTGVGAPNLSWVNFLARPWPNPSSLPVTIHFGLAHHEPAATLSVFDVQGRLVRSIRSGPVGAGIYQLRWDLRNSAAKDVATGIYFLRLSASTFTRSERVVVIR